MPPPFGCAVVQVDEQPTSVAGQLQEDTTEELLVLRGSPNAAALPVNKVQLDMQLDTDGSSTPAEVCNLPCAAALLRLMRSRPVAAVGSHLTTCHNL